MRLNTYKIRLNIYKMWLNTNKIRLNINNLRLNTYSKRDWILHHLSNHKNLHSPIFYALFSNANKRLWKTIKALFIKGINSAKIPLYIKIIKFILTLKQLMHWILIFQNSIQSEYRKIRTRKNSVFGYFSRSDKHIKRKYKITNYFKFSKIAYEGILKEVNNLDNKIKAWYIINILFKRQELNL